MHSYSPFTPRILRADVVKRLPHPGTAVKHKLNRRKNLRGFSRAEIIVHLTIRVIKYNVRLLSIPILFSRERPLAYQLVLLEGEGEAPAEPETAGTQ